MGKAVIIACDFPNAEKCYEFLDRFEDEKLYLKVGMELFYAEGPQMVKEIKKRGHQIFLDLKLHDIPNTVKKAMTSLRNLDVDMVNVHAQGTIKMMEAAVEGLTRDDGTRPIIIAVTQLTSTTEDVMKDELKISLGMADEVKNLARNAKTAGLDGVVCSPLESEVVHEACGKDFCTVTPGIRFADDSKDDQVRVSTPEKAKKLGSDYIVVGRSITQAENPFEAYRKAVSEFVD